MSNTENYNRVPMWTHVNENVELRKLNLVWFRTQLQSAKSSKMMATWNEMITKLESWGF